MSVEIELIVVGESKIEVIGEGCVFVRVWFCVVVDLRDCVGV